MGYDLNALAANYQPVNFETPRRQASTSGKRKGRGGSLTSFISEAGGTGGALGGAAIGAGLGSVVPVLGTAIGGLAGALIGGFGGGTVGRGIENKVRDDQNFLGEGGSAKSALTEGAISGVMGAGPLRLLKGAGTAAKAATVGKQGLTDALLAGGTKATAQKTPGRVANKLNGLADGLAQRGMRLNESGFATKHANRTGEEVGETLRRFKIPSYGVKGADEQVLKPGFSAYSGAVESIGTIPKVEVYKQIQAQISKEAGSKVPASQAFAKDVLKEAKGVLDNFGDNISATELNAVKSEIAGRVNYEATDTVSRNANEILNRVSKGFRGSINDAADKAGIKADAGLSKLGYKSTKVGDLGEELNNLKSLLEQADKKSRVGAGSSPFGLIPAVMTASGGPAGLAAGATAQMVNSSAGRSMLAKGADKLANRAAGRVTSQTAGTAMQGLDNLGGIKKLTARTAVGTPLVNALTGNQSGNSMQTSDTTNTSTMPPNISIDSLSQSFNDNANAETEVDASNPFNPANANASIQQILANGGNMDDVKDYLGVVSTMQELQSMSNPTAKPISATAAKQLATANSGIDSLNTLESIINNGGVPKGTVVAGRGLLGGLGQNVLGTASFDAAADNIADTIVRMRTGAAATKDEMRTFRAQLPQASDSPAVRAQKLATVRGYLQSIADGTGMSSAETDTEDLISALR